MKSIVNLIFLHLEYVPLLQTLEVVLVLPLISSEGSESCRDDGGGCSDDDYPLSEDVTVPKYRPLVGRIKGKKDG